MRYFLIAGEASGDLHASNLMCELKKADHKATFCFLGGDLMQAQGGEMIKHYRDMAYMGFWAVLKNFRKIVHNFDITQQTIKNFNPDVVILIDYPGFNLRIARYIKTELNIPVHYYIPPKIWAWKSYRIKEIKKYIDKVYPIFPFEVDFYNKYNYKVEYWGNPTVDSISDRPLQQQSFEAFCTKNNIKPKPIIALLAGSRKQEISYCLPRMLRAASQFDDYQVIIAGAPGIDASFYNRFLHRKTIPIVFDQTYQLVQHARVAIVNSGTATLETALIGTPQVVVYYVMMGRLAYLAKNIFIKIKYISLVNLISDRETVKELIAHKFTVLNIKNELNEILENDDYRTKMLSEYDQIRDKLGKSGAAKRTAQQVVESIQKS